MSVYVDGEENSFRGMKMSHMVADTLDELHTTAGYFTLDGFNTIAYVMDEEKLPLDKWIHISQGGVFGEVWEKLFQGRVPIPISLLQLRNASNDVRHAAGLIILFFEKTVEERVPIFLREPETHLHPAEARCIMGMIKKLQYFCGIACRGPKFVPKPVPKGRRLNLEV